MLVSPLWPPALPSGRSLNRFMGMAISSTITSKLTICISSLVSQYLTAFPLRFIKVVGTMQMTGLLRSLILATPAYRFTLNEPLCLCTNMFATSKPILCRVPSYSVPALPNPTIRNLLIIGGKNIEIHIRQIHKQKTRPKPGQKFPVRMDYFLAVGAAAGDVPAAGAAAPAAPGAADAAGAATVDSSCFSSRVNTTEAIGMRGEFRIS